MIGEVTLASGRTAQYYVDARRALLSADGFVALGELVAAEARRVGAAAVGGPTLGADPIAHERVWDLLYRACVHGRKGPTMMAIIPSTGPSGFVSASTSAT